MQGKNRTSPFFKEGTQFFSSNREPESGQRFSILSFWPGCVPLHFWHWCWWASWPQFGRRFPVLVGCMSWHVRSRPSRLNIWPRFPMPACPRGSICVRKSFPCPWMRAGARGMVVMGPAHLPRPGRTKPSRAREPTVRALQWWMRQGLCGPSLVHQIFCHRSSCSTSGPYHANWSRACGQRHRRCFYAVNCRSWLSP